MIILEKIRWKNFLSTGDTWTEVVLNKHRRTLISGKNGSGKSTLLDAWCFNWYGKPFRNIKKNSIINSINTKNCLTESEFKINGVQFMVRRGIAPAVFEIYQNGELINQEAKSKDYQKHLENNILKVEQRPLEQVAILGSASFTPFMQMPLGARRATIEDLLDISVFSRMNSTLKDQQKQMKDEYAEVSQRLSTGQRNIKTFEALLETITNQKDDIVNFKRDSIEQAKKRLEVISKEMTAMIEKKAEVEKKYLEKKATYDEYQNAKNRLVHDCRTGEIRDQKDEDFYAAHDHCDVCKQEIDDKFKSKMSGEIQKNRRDRQQLRDMIAEQDQKWMGIGNEINAMDQEIRGFMTSLGKFAGEIQTLQGSVASTIKEIESIEKKTDDIAKVQAELTKARDEVDRHQKLLNGFGEKSNYFTAMNEMLKDGGIKTKIIRQYLPKMNKYINDHLQTLDFFVNFVLNETFEEKILSRHMDDFSYYNFSEGEKHKINLAVLFAWREIAKRKNSCSTNVLILDEIMDSSLDSEGMDNLMTLLESIDPATNVVVISHRGVNESSFERHLRFEKKQNFSELV